MLEIVLWVGVSQSLFAAITILNKEKRTISDKILAGWLFLFAIQFLTCISDYKIYGYPILSSSFLLFNPAFYFYVKSLIKTDFKLKYKHLLHLTPFFIFEILAYIFGEKIMLNEFFEINNTLSFRLAFGIANILSWMGYNISSYIMLHRHRKSLKDEFSSFSQKLTLGWLFFIIIIYSAYCFSSFFIAIGVIITEKRLLLPHFYNYYFLLGIIYILSFYGVFQPQIFTNTKISSDNKYKTSILDEKQKQTIKELIFSFFEKEKPYLNPDFNMDYLSEAIQIPKYQITEVLNTVIGKNFFNFVNSYRVEEVKKLLTDKNVKWSIEAIGYECGFNSKSSFFSVFKKFTGLTPNQYQKKFRV